MKGINISLKPRSLLRVRSVMAGEKVLILLLFQAGFVFKSDIFDILASGKTDYHCKVKENLFIQDLQPALNANVNSEKLLLY